jgi:hypothetical protein
MEHRGFLTFPNVLRALSAWLVILVALMWAASSHAQTTCPAVGPSPPLATNDVRLNWTAPTLFTDGNAIPSSSPITYTVYRSSGASGPWSAICTTTAVATTLGTQPAGTQSYRVTAKTPASTPANVESAPSNVATKDIAQLPNPPTGLTIVTVTVTVTVPGP